MQQIKSSKKDTTNAKKSNISVISEKYQFFSAFVRSEKEPTESIEAFMNRIGMGARRPDYRAFVSGIKNITELNFNKIRMALRWDHIETAQWEELWEKDQELKSLKLKRKLNTQPTKQIQETTTHDMINNTNTPPSPEPDHCCRPDVRVLIRDFKTLTEHRHELDDAVFQRFLEFAYHVSDNKIQEFAERNNLEWDWFKDVTDTGMVEFFKTEEALETFLFENLHFDDRIHFLKIFVCRDSPCHVLLVIYPHNTLKGVNQMTILDGFLFGVGFMSAALIVSIMLFMTLVIIEPFLRGGGKDAHLD